MVEANANVIHRLGKMVRHKMKHNVSWCSKSQQERQAQAGETCQAKANAKREADAGKGAVAKANAEGEAQLGKLVRQANAKRET